MEKQSKVSTGRGGKRPGAGRPKGSVAKTTQALKDAILEAAKLTGYDGKGKGGLVGYLQSVAETDTKAFAGLLGKVLPLTVAGLGADGAIIVQAGPLDERL